VPVRTFDPKGVEALERAGAQRPRGREAPIRGKVVVPVLDAKALKTDPEGAAFLKDVLAQTAHAGRSGSKDLRPIALQKPLRDRIDRLISEVDRTA
jgi:hypothetical protein